jgi:hypothetical protein
MTERSFVRTIISLSVFLVLFAAGTLAGITWQHHRQPTAPPRPAVTTVHTPEEDQPGWDCATMGNRTCGPTSVTA